ncbi:MAG: hypothetical protein D6677_09160 [Calditrichaeota bacterium]|nr:MAG: hypothetical protein D6677_09160 [Calditrichota bacterium]
MKKRLKTALVLGGGGARGLAHIGVIKVLQKHGIPIDIVTGTSMGGIIGALYAYKQDSAWLEKQVRHFLSSEAFEKTGSRYLSKISTSEPEDLLRQLSHEIKKRLVINLAAHRVSLLKGERLQLTIDTLIPNIEISELQIPFACCAADLYSGQCVTFSKGHLRKALRASASIPGFIPPLETNGHLFIDGSVCENFPVQAALDMGAEFIIGVNVSQNMERSNDYDNVIDIIIRANQISTHKLDLLLMEKMDCIIRPRTGHIHWSNFEAFDTLITIGARAAEESMPEIKRCFTEQHTLRKRWYRKIIQWMANSALREKALKRNDL